MRCTVPVPMPSDFATSKMPTPLRKILSHLPLVLAADLRPAELHARSNRPLEARQFIAQAARLGSRAAFVRGGATCGLSNPVGSPAAESPSRRKALTAASRPYTSHDLGPAEEGKPGNQGQKPYVEPVKNHLRINGRTRRNRMNIAT